MAPKAKKAKLGDPSRNERNEVDEISGDLQRGYGENEEDESCCLTKKGRAFSEEEMAIIENEDIYLWEKSRRFLKQNIVFTSLKNDHNKKQTYI